MMFSFIENIDGLLFFLQVGQKGPEYKDKYNSCAGLSKFYWHRRQRIDGCGDPRGRSDGRDPVTRFQGTAIRWQPWK
jgi:hypothetical protein